MKIFKKRTYPEYNFDRRGLIWTTREEYLRYEEALFLEAQIDQDLKEVSQRAKTAGRASKTPAAADAGNVDEDRDGMKEETKSVQKARKVKRVFLEKIYPIYHDLVNARIEEEKVQMWEEQQVKAEGGEVESRAGLERFEPGLYLLFFSD